MVNDRCATVPMAELRNANPQTMAYTLPDVKAKRRVEPKEVERKEGSEDAQREKKEKESDEQRAKRLKKEIGKDWPGAMEHIEQWARKQPGALPGNVQKWERVLRSEIIKKLYPGFQEKGDIEQLAVRASSIDYKARFAAENVEDEPKQVCARCGVSPWCLLASLAWQCLFGFMVLHISSFSTGSCLVLTEEFYAGS